MGFFDKLKESASKAADKAKDSVEIVRLNSQISAKRGEIKKLYAQIGRIVFQAHAADQLSSTQELIQSASESIIVLQQEIEELEHKIKIIKDEKDCVCGQVLSLEAKFCSTCGHKFEDNNAETSVGRIEVIALPPVEASAELATSGNAESPEAGRACPSCEAPLGESDRFCENCGTAVN